MDLNSVEMFVAVVRAGSLSAAARHARVPLATLSRNVRALEAELGVHLLARSARGSTLTEAGTALYEHASRGIDALHEGHTAVTDRRRVLKGRLRISIPPSFEPWWDLLAEFQRAHADVQVAAYTSSRHVDLSIEGIDVALRIGLVGAESLVAKKILRYRHVLVASPALVARLGMPETPDDLRSLPCGAWTRDANTQAVWRLGDRAFAPLPTLAVNDYLHLRRRVLAGDVIAELPPFLAADALREGHLVQLLPEHPFPEQDVTLLYQQRRHPSSVIRAYLDFCGARAASYVAGT